MINDNEKKNMFRYYVTQRPIDIGTIPNAKSAVNITRYEERKKLPGVDREVYGYVEYTTKLSKAEIESYELTEKILTDGNTLENKKEITINDVNIRSTHGEEKYVYVIRKNNGKYILSDIVDSIEEKREAFEGNIKGIGVGIPGPVTADGTVLKCANLGWDVFSVSNKLASLTGVGNVKVGNDANVAALGEMWKGGGVGYRNMIMVTLGTGVGGGIIINGKILTGENGAGGEIGHMCVNLEETDTCGCGGHGCLEQYASATGISRLARKKMEHETRATILTKEDLSAKAVFDAVKEGDEVAIEVATEMGNYLGHAMADMAAVLDPAVFVIGGGVSKAGEVLLSFIEKPFMEKAFFANKNVKFKLATLGNDAGICGAAKLVLED